MKTRKELMLFVSNAEAIIKKYGWEQRKTYPYPGCPMDAIKIINDCKSYDECTECSKDYLLDLATGFEKILNAWVKHKEAPKVKVRIKSNGNVVEINKDDLDMFADVVEVI